MYDLILGTSKCSIFYHFLLIFIDFLWIFIDFLLIFIDFLKGFLASGAGHRGYQRCVPWPVCSPARSRLALASKSNQCPARFAPSKSILRIRGIRTPPLGEGGFTYPLGHPKRFTSPSLCRNPLGNRWKSIENQRKSIESDTKSNI